VWDINTCFEIAMTSYNVYPPPKQIPGYTTGFIVWRAEMHTFI